MNKPIVRGMVLAVAVLLLFTADLTGLWRPVRSGIALAQGGPSLDWWVIAGGGAPASGGNVTLSDTLGQPVIGTASGGTIGLTAGYWHGCTAAAAVAPAVSVTRNDEDVVLTWDPDPANVRYQVWVSTNPYFDPDHPGGVPPVVTADTTYTDTGAAADPAHHFYVVRGLNACGAASGNSVRKGEFTFGLVPGTQ